jgi:hypothetical protein
MLELQKSIPIYTSHGEAGAIFVRPFIFNLSGEWIGWVDSEDTVYSVHGHFVGKLTGDQRIVRKREWGYGRERKTPPPSPGKIRPPTHFPLAPSLAELPTYMIDVLVDNPELMPSVDFGDLREDLD